MLGSAKAYAFITTTTTPKYNYNNKALHRNQYVKHVSILIAVKLITIYPIWLLCRLQIVIFNLFGINNIFNILTTAAVYLNFYLFYPMAW